MSGSWLNVSTHPFSWQKFGQLGVQFWSSIQRDVAFGVLIYFVSIKNVFIFSC